MICPSAIEEATVSEGEKLSPYSPTHKFWPVREYDRMKNLQQTLEFRESRQPEKSIILFIRFGEKACFRFFGGESSL